MQFQATCSKWHKKLTLSISAESIEEARKILHKQGYSIIEIHEVTDTSVLQSGNFFYFDLITNGIVQSGKIQSDDIFKAYRKLVEDLKYDIVYIYNLPEMPEEQKKIITAKVKDGYGMYLESIGKKIESEAKKQEKKNNEELEEFSPQLLKELEKYKKFTDDALEEIQNLIIKNHEIITPEQKYALEQMELQLTQIRWLRNVGRIHAVIEDVMKRKGTIEIEILKKSTIKEKEKFLAETNRILKGIGSSEKIETEEQKQETVEYKLKSFFEDFVTKKVPEKKKTEHKIDTHSFVYFKNKRELDIYKKAFQDNDIAIVRAIFSFQFLKAKKLFLKRKLLSQNIQIIENRIQNKSISYTKIVHGIDYYFNLFFGFLASAASFLVMGLFLYSIFFIVVQTLSSLEIIKIFIQPSSILFLTILSIFCAILLLVRGWWSLLFSVPVFFYISWFLIVNF